MSKRADRRSKGRGRAYGRRPSPVAVLDTNVIIETHSIHDIVVDHEKVASLGDAARMNPRVAMRITRARESLFLAIHLHETRATTFGLRSEMVDTLLKSAPPKEFSTNWETAFTTFWIHFVKSKVLCNWQHTVPGTADGRTGNWADRALVAKARRLGVPLVSNEGRSHTGAVDETKLVRRHGSAEGVRVMLPKEFYADKLDERAAAASFLRRFAEFAPEYIETHRRRLGDDDIVAALGRLRDVYDFILSE